jgi:hypothetical protein
VGYVSFDIEIAREIPEGATNWKAYRPFGITCAATITDTKEAITWTPPIGADGRYAPQMAHAILWDLVGYLGRCQAAGSPIVGWNTLSFDLDVLAEECEVLSWQSRCADLAMAHIDIMFQFMCERGFPIGLDNVCRAMGVGGKYNDLHGDLAPQRWKGDRASQEENLRYVERDAAMGAEVYEAILSKGYIEWIAKSSGRRQRHVPLFTTEGGAKRLLTVTECMQLPLPDTSWMVPRPGQKALTRETFYAWVLATQKEALREQDMQGPLTMADVPPTPRPLAV